MASKTDLTVSKKSKQKIKVSCTLLPFHQAAAFIIGLVALSTVCAGFAPVTVLTLFFGIAQWIAIPVVIASAMRLTFHLTQRGIEATSTLHKQTLYDRNKRRWKDLHSVRITKLVSPSTIFARVRNERDSRLRRQSPWDRALNFLGRGWMQQGFIIFDFRSGGVAALPLAGLSVNALEDLFIALSRWADPLSLNPEVIALQRNILAGQELNLSESYTKMWEDSLRDRFEATNFVPLLGGHELQGGAIKILMLMACGGMSSIYLARDRQGNRCVVKEMAVPIDNESIAKQKLHEMFAKEAAFLARIEHADVVKVKDHFVENDRDYLVLDFIPGLTLRQHVQLSGGFPEDQVIDIGIQIADILHYLHQLVPPVVHRDLTPDNLIVREPERTIALIDLGAATEFVGKVTGTLIGKQCYIPPEQFQGHATPQSDIYALGATLYFLLLAQDPQAISQSHPKTAGADISEQIDQIIARATCLDLDKRISSAEEIRAELLALKESRRGAVVERKR